MIFVSKWDPHMDLVKGLMELMQIILALIRSLDKHADIYVSAHMAIYAVHNSEKRTVIYVGYFQ